MAYLIDRQGAICSNNEICGALGESTEEGELGYSYLNALRRDLSAVFEEAGYPDVILRSRGGMRIDMEKISCDYYDLLKGEPSAIHAYNGEYMSQYSWAEYTNGELWNKFHGD